MQPHTPHPSSSASSSSSSSSCLTQEPSPKACRGSPTFAGRVQDKLQTLPAKALWPVMKAHKENCKYWSCWQNSELALGWSCLSPSGRFDPRYWCRPVLQPASNSRKRDPFHQDRVFFLYQKQGGNKKAVMKPRMVRRMEQHNQGRCGLFCGSQSKSSFEIIHRK